MATERKTVLVLDAGGGIGARRRGRSRGAAGVSALSRATPRATSGAGRTAATGSRGSAATRWTGAR